MDKTSSRNPERRFAVLGPTQSGKTCLAVGLYHTDHPVTVDTRETDTRQYLADLGTQMSEGGRPASTNKDTRKEIRLKFDSRDSHFTAAFLDFAGEKLGTDEEFQTFANEHFRNLDGAVLLVNPGADAFQPDAATYRQDGAAPFEKIFGETKILYRRILDHLADANKNPVKPIVALAVTASDLLPSLGKQGKLGHFEECLQLISSRLRSNGFEWKRFDVTVAGLFGQQGAAERARGNTSSAPFLWLDGQVKKRQERPERVRFRKRFRNTVLGVLALLAVSATTYRMIVNDRETPILESCENALDNCFGNSPPAADDLLAAAREMAALDAKKFSKKNAARAQTIREKYDLRLPDGFRDCIVRKIEDFSGKDTDRETVDRLFRAWAEMFPEPSGTRTDLQEKWTKKQYMARLEDSAGRGDLKGLAALSPFQFRAEGTLTDEFVREQWENRFEGAFSAARRHWLDRWLATMADREGRPAATPQDEQKFKGEAAVIGPPLDQDASWEELLQMVEQAAREWDARQEAESARQLQECKNWVLSHVHPDLPRTGSDGLIGRYRNARKSREFQDNPWFNRVVRTAVHRQVEDWLAADVRYLEENLGTSLFGGNQHERGLFCDRFYTFKETCLDLAKAEDEDPAPDVTSWAFYFVRLCKKDGKIGNEFGIAHAFPQEFTVTRMECRMAYSNEFSSRYEQTSFTAFLTVTAPDGGSEEIPLGIAKALPAGEDKEWVDVLEGGFGKEIGLFNRVALTVKGCVELNWGVDEDVEIVSEDVGADWFHGGAFREFVVPVNYWEGEDTPRACVRIHGRWEGKKPTSFLEKAEAAAEAARNGGTDR